ncbi:tripartite tricarboxylate transporter substrate binding protein [Xylophilus rhododendri]|uniref:Tripartite tricarboxylate transporter substrate binding protein n=1 Tax=Xylophilus rhododendri TaxID=2697032 RepID=A0A857JA66_9BURK|nr:tripartite tricarboxylate transporter substrate binding protein [Xylophilus rhododendri]QHJ00885.1 tripartite tricarboxylate transporter substrate binding protein [Xylophilus rhododendri]
MDLKISRFARLLAPLLVGLCLGAPALADDYPSKPVRIVVPYTPGGFNDTLARTVGERLGRSWKQSVVVDNRPGGNTVLGNNLVAKAPADGYTMLITPLPFSALPALYGNKLPYHALKDFTPLIWAASTQNVLVVRNDLGVSSVAELIAMAKARPGKLNYGSTGSGSSNHLSMELFEAMTQSRMTHVPYKGSAPAVMAMLGGEIDVLFDNVPNVMQQIKAGKIKPIGVTGTSRAVLLPEVPTVAESGVPGYEVNVWFGMQMPAGTPKAIVDKANQDIVAILKEPEVIRQFREQGVEVVGSTPEAFGQLLQKEVPKWTKVIEDAGVKLE